MAENKEGQEKTEEPSSRRLEQARKKGQVATTKELSPVLMLFGALGMLTLWAPTVWRRLQTQSQSWFEMAGRIQLNPESAHGLLLDSVDVSTCNFCKNRNYGAKKLKPRAG